MCAKKLFVVGNGFDIYHGIPSSFSDFRKYLENADRELCRKLEQYFSYEDFWSDFEQSLADFDGDYLVDNASVFLASYEEDDWSDSYHYDFQYEINKIVTAFSETLKSRLTEWILKLTIPSALDISNKRLNYVDENAIFLTFNYTETLQVAYSIHESNVLHIHGKAESEKSNLVLGHAWKPVNRNSLMSPEDLENQDVRLAEGDAIIDEYFKATYKPAEEIIKANRAFFSSLHPIEEIYVLGHSISNVDIIYFQELAKSIISQNTKWRISYLDDDDLTTHTETMNNLGIHANLISFSELQNM
ncbi:MAG: bacteriophage abortive infection AbiH family protein [Methylococcales bacterium]